MARSLRGRRKDGTAINSRKKLANKSDRQLSREFAGRDIERPIKKIKVKIRSTKRLDKKVKEYLLDGHPRRKNAVINRYAPIEPPKQRIGKLKRKPQPVRWG